MNRSTNFNHNQSKETDMQPHQQRVVDEKTDLDDKLGKLKTFFEGPIFSTVPADERRRLEKQAGIMGQYSEILGERISAF